MNPGSEQQQIKGSWSFEDLPGDWGVVTSLSQECYVCGVVVNAFGTVVAFPCGHCFHACCVPEDACPICFSQKFVSVVPATTNPITELS